MYLTRERPLLETEFNQKREKEQRHLCQLIAHASLDLVEARARATSQCFLKSVDRFNEWHISAYLTPGGAKFIMVHDQINEDAVRNFFQDVNDIWLRLRLNPFYNPDGEIKNKSFLLRVRAIGQRLLAMELKELLKWVNGHLRLRNSPEIQNFTRDWVDGKAYLSIIYNHRPDMIRLDVSNQSPDEMFEQIVQVSETKLKIKPFFSQEDLLRGSALLENITFVAELYYLLAQERGMKKNPEETCFISSKEKEGSSLTRRLFERCEFEKRFHEICSTDEDILNNNSLPQLENFMKKEAGEKIKLEDEKSATSESGFDLRLKFKEITIDSNSESDNAQSNNPSIKSGNPFGDDSEEEQESLKEETEEREKRKESENGNPFGDCESSDEGAEEVKVPIPAPRSKITEPPGNPFGSASEDEEEDDSETNPFAKKPPARPPPPKIVNSPRKKEMAPLPPPNVAPFNPSRPKRPPPPKPKGKAPGYGNPVVKRTVTVNTDEIRSQLLKVEEEIHGLESQCQKLEDIIRVTESQDDAVIEDDQELFKEWISIIKNRTALAEKHKFLGYQLRFNLLDERHAELEYQMRKVLNKPCEDDSHVEVEELLMAQIVDVVNKKDELSQLIENSSKPENFEPEAQFDIPAEKQVARVKKSGTIRKLKKILIKKPKDKPEKSKKSAKK
ncbi:Oidioi.mRNA.OKI2018_I69.XSR.g15031.t1.cds [Oikopleura dioica]|uniref:Oidioi.mRNA.OKI2018_I69.XSR.g15031.t1.cds n=1 Tax=Oikopleura dioica TaxID=34765 RepID=A0ABN7SDB0_OIKDI|nr:Oidioi.mRNA.OKI2018_I69.XSR.g15031.t1.cds [Oikopleura dioica]